MEKENGSLMASFSSVCFYIFQCVKQTPVGFCISQGNMVIHMWLWHSSDASNGGTGCSQMFHFIHFQFAGIKYMVAQPKTSQVFMD